MLDAQQVARMRETYCADRRMHADFLTAFQRTDNFRYQYVGRVNQMRCAINALARLSARVCALAPPPQEATSLADAHALGKTGIVPDGATAEAGNKERRPGASLFGAAMAQLQVMRQQPTPERARRALDTFLRSVGVGGVRGGSGGGGPSVPRGSTRGAFLGPGPAFRIRH